MAPKFYMTVYSGGCRAVWMACEAVGLEVDVVLVDLNKGEQHEPWFHEINPRDCLPTLVDDGATMCESRAILRYLANKYGKDTSLYPADPKQRFLVDLALDSDIGLIYKAVGAYIYPKIFHGIDPDEAAIKGVESALTHFNDVMLQNSKFVAGDSVTIGDISIFASLQQLMLAGFKYEAFSKHEKVLAFMDSFKSLPYYEKCNSEFNKAVGL